MKLDVLIELLKTNLGRALIVLPLVILANIILGAAQGTIDGEWSKEKFIKGLTKGFMVYLGIGLYALVSYLAHDLQIEFNGSSYSLVDAMYLVIWGAVLAYSTDGIKKLSELFKLKVGE